MKSFALFSILYALWLMSQLMTSAKVCFLTEHHLKISWLLDPFMLNYHAEQLNVGLPLQCWCTSYTYFYHLLLYSSHISGWAWPTLYFCTGHHSERQPLGSVRPAATQPMPDKPNLAKLGSILKVIVRKLQVIPDVPRGNQVAAAKQLTVILTASWWQLQSPAHPSTHAHTFRNSLPSLWIAFRFCCQTHERK